MAKRVLQIAEAVLAAVGTVLERKLDCYSISTNEAEWVEIVVMLGDDKCLEIEVRIPRHQAGSSGAGSPEAES